MKKLYLWVMAATLICGVTTVCLSLNSCKETQAQEKQVQSTELIRTSQSWDGAALPDYLQGRPEIVAVKYEILAGEKLGRHHHPVMNFTKPSTNAEPSGIFWTKRSILRPSSGFCKMEVKII